MSTAAGDGILVLDPRGRLDKTLGGRGDGPGEFRNINTLVVGSDDSLYVLEARQRATVFSASGQFVRTFQVPVRPAIVAAAEGLLLINGALRTPASAGYPLHAVNLDGGLVRSFGVAGEPAVDGRCRACDARHAMPGLAGETMWLATPNLYVIEEWSLLGERRRRISVKESRWMVPWDTVSDWLTGKVRRPTALVAAYVTTNDTLWVIAGVPPAEWTPVPAAGSSQRLFRSRAEMLKIVLEARTRNSATRVDVIDLRAGTVIRGGTFPAMDAIAPGVFFRFRETADAELLIEIVEVRLAQPSRGGSS